jgi:hypothetical protein
MANGQPAAAGTARVRTCCRTTAVYTCSCTAGVRRVGMHHVLRARVRDLVRCGCVVCILAVAAAHVSVYAAAKACARARRRVGCVAAGAAVACTLEQVHPTAGRSKQRAGHVWKYRGMRSCQCGCTLRHARLSPSVLREGAGRPCLCVDPLSQNSREYHLLDVVTMYWKGVAFNIGPQAFLPCSAWSTGGGRVHVTVHGVRGVAVHGMAWRPCTPVLEFVHCAGFFGPFLCCIYTIRAVLALAHLLAADAGLQLVLSVWLPLYKERVSYRGKVIASGGEQ